MVPVKFLSEVITVYSGEKKEFDYKNNYGYDKSANFRLINLSKINCKMVVLLSYISPGFGSKKVYLGSRIFNSLTYCYGIDSELLLTLAFSH